MFLILKGLHEETGNQEPVWQWVIRSTLLWYVKGHGWIRKSDIGAVFWVPRNEESIRTDQWDIRTFDRVKSAWKHGNKKMQVNVEDFKLIPKGWGEREATFLLWSIDLGILKVALLKRERNKRWEEGEQYSKSDIPGRTGEINFELSQPPKRKPAFEGKGKGLVGWLMDLRLVDNCQKILVTSRNSSRVLENLLNDWRSRTLSWKGVAVSWSKEYRFCKLYRLRPSLHCRRIWRRSMRRRKPSRKKSELKRSRVTTESLSLKARYQVSCAASKIRRARTNCSHNSSNWR